MTTARLNGHLWHWLPVLLTAAAWIFTVGVASNRLERLDRDLQDVRASMAGVRTDLTSASASWATEAAQTAILKDRVDRIVDHLIPKPTGVH